MLPQGNDRGKQKVLFCEIKFCTKVFVLVMEWKQERERQWEKWREVEGSGMCKKWGGGIEFAVANSGMGYESNEWASCIRFWGIGYVLLKLSCKVYYMLLILLWVGWIVVQIDHFISEGEYFEKASLSAIVASLWFCCHRFELWNNRISLLQKCKVKLATLDP